MRVTSITVKDKPPIKNFEVTNLSSVIVLAGPNGIGKTRLIQQLISLLQSPRSDQSLSVKISATSPDEKILWKKDSLSTLDNNDLNILRQHLQRNKKRGKYISSIVNFDSLRTFETIRPFQWSWDFRDPFDEDIVWDFLFHPFRDRYQDTIHALYRKIGHYRTEISKKYEELRKAGEKQMPIDSTDPLKKFKDIFRLLLSPKELSEIPVESPKLEYLENGQLLPIDSLSSGEREVFTIVFDLLLHEPSDCIIFFDEPEMHLHPELSFRLLRALESVGARNQFIFCTHSADIITQSLNHSVIFIKPPDGNKNQAVCVWKEEEKSTALNLLGQNLGVIAFGKKIVLIEGNEASLDKLTYGEIVGNSYPQYVLIPTGSRQTALSFSRIVNDVLSKSLWGIDFFMIADHDSNLPEELMVELVSKSLNRLAFLPRYNLENYFLDENVISRMFEKMEPGDSWLRNPKDIKEKLKQIARDTIPYAVQLYLGSSLRTKVGEIEITVKDIDKMMLEDYLSQLDTAISKEQERVKSIVHVETVKNVAKERWTFLVNIINDSNEDWKKIMPGKVIYHKFSSLTGVDKGQFKTMYINQAKEEEFAPFKEIIDIFERFNTLAR